MPRFDLTDKVALVAGASRGIGAAIAHGLAEQGAQVICSSRDPEACAQVSQAICAKGFKADSMRLHLGELADHDRVLAAIEQDYGRLDILISNGATNPYMGPAHNISEGAYDKTFAVNLKGPYFLASKSIPLLLKSGGGAIVNVASIDGLNPGQFRAVYGMTKAGLINMTKGFAKEYSQQGIRVNALLPGFTDTKLAEALKKMPELDRYMRENLSIHRMAQPEEMVGAVLYMVSDEASYFTGQCMIVDGGATI